MRQGYRTPPASAPEGLGTIFGDSGLFVASFGLDQARQAEFGKFGTVEAKCGMKRHTSKRNGTDPCRDSTGSQDLSTGYKT